MEYYLKVRGDDFRLDAFDPGNRTVVEFVHTLSDSYRPKERVLRRAGYKVIWLFDGAEFVSAHAKICKGRTGKGLRRMLKPKAADQVSQLRSCVLVHYNGQLWKHWRENVFYPLYDSWCTPFCEAMSDQLE